MITALIELFKRDLNKLKTELNAYEDEKDIWKIADGISNSGGNLTLHLVGNLQHFIGAVLDNSSYVRDRESEFTMKHIPRVNMINEIEQTSKIVEDVLLTLKSEDLNEFFPIDVFKKKMTTQFFLLHLTTHLNYHLGQINYHRRLIS